nr:MAG TPA: hypothetical protein [Caudoviricetes sp.]
MAGPSGCRGISSEKRGKPSGFPLYVAYGSQDATASCVSVRIGFPINQILDACRRIKSRA